MKLLIALFSPAAGTWGGVTRGLAIAKAARQQGHQVAFCASGEVRNTVEKHGYQTFDAPAPTMFGLPKSISNHILKRSQSTTIPVRPGVDFASIWFVFTFSGLAKVRYLNKLVQAEVAAARQFDADILFTDLDPAAFITSKITGLPITSTFTSVMTRGTGSLPWQLMKRAINRVLKQFNQATQTPDELFFGPEVLKLVPSIPALDDADPDRKDIEYIGHLFSEIKKTTPSDDLIPSDGQKLVFVYTGTGSISIDTLRIVLPQVFPANGDTRCMVGAQSVKQVEKIGNVEFHPYLPADQILRHASWTLCHGGQNTIIQSLQNGVPLLLFPGPIFERRFNARKVQAAGAGFMGEIPDFTVEWLKNVLTEQDTAHTQAQTLAKTIQSFGGATAGIKAMETWLKTQESKSQ